MTKDLQREATKSKEQIFKLKFLDFTERITSMSALEFDRISQGRVEKQTTEACMAITKSLYAALKEAMKVIEEKE